MRTKSLELTCYLVLCLLDTTLQCRFNQMKKTVVCDGEEGNVYLSAKRTKLIRSITLVNWNTGLSLSVNNVYGSLKKIILHSDNRSLIDCDKMPNGVRVEDNDGIVICTENPTEETPKAHTQISTQTTAQRNKQTNTQSTTQTNTRATTQTNKLIKTQATTQTNKQTNPLSTTQTNTQATTQTNKLIKTQATTQTPSQATAQTNTPSETTAQTDKYTGHYTDRWMTVPMDKQTTAHESETTDEQHKQDPSKTWFIIGIIGGKSHFIF
ncbi:putative uncharacterized protein DDB_G0290521 [Pecten maximus]|uniref:putative uncharacterized protein DDB_G0290521 n=1 Tax=Pecten maximus TaxID=6579 RepID=UPI001458D5C5|nr:putative uncharacterized protein DDB_G0290521 [Pecten maximus]